MNSVYSWGGEIGGGIYSLVEYTFGGFGFVILLFLWGVSLYLNNLIPSAHIHMWFTGKSYRNMFGRGSDENIHEYEDEEEYESEEIEDEQEEVEEGDDEEEKEEEVVDEIQEEKETKTNNKRQINKKPIKRKQTTLYIAPPLSLLLGAKSKHDAGNTKEVAQTIKRTLDTFGLSVTIEEIIVGPTFTRYAFKPAEGVRLQKIVALQNNLELAVATHPIRVEAPIPGRSLIGIEVPNKARAMVTLRSLLAKNKDDDNTPLKIVLGKTIMGTVFTLNLASLPHILVGGTTGSGKSVLIHNIILSLIFRHSPRELRLIMIDPKRVEFSLYEDLPHLYTPVVVEPKKALQVLSWTVCEMDRRYELLQKYKERTLEGYNEVLLKKDPNEEEDKYMPYIVVIIDEMADLMQSFPREIEATIVRIAQKARAVGIHLVLSTQRPSVNVITGLLKANIPARIALQVASQIDSRTIIDAVGAETLTGKGDFMYISVGSKKPTRVQSAFVSDKEIKAIVKFLARKNTIPLDGLTIGDIKKSNSSIGSFGGDDDDELMAEAIEIVKNAKKASTSLLQRRLKIGYSRAARLIDMMEDKGFVGEQKGSKPREVFLEDE